MRGSPDLSQAPRSPLTRARVVDAAVVLADQHGIGALSMRRLGTVLGVEAMSLYNHVSGKDDLLDEMIDRVFGEVEFPKHELDWRQAMRDRAVSLRAALLRHRWAIGLMESRSRPGPATLQHHDAVLGCLRGAGFSVPMAAHAFAVLDSYIYGFALQQANLPFSSTAELTALADTILPRLEQADLHHIAELVTEHALQPGYNFADEFPFGLELVLDGLERCREART